jgi:PAS domain S-box-containing protein
MNIRRENVPTETGRAPTRGPRPADPGPLQILRELPVAVYATDAIGRITYYNDAAASLWGRPKLGDEWSGVSQPWFHADGAPMPPAECPMTVTLETGKSVPGVECFAERLDGARASFIAQTRPLHDDNGQRVGAVCAIVDTTGQKRDEEAAQRLAAIIESSDDAILSKDLNGVIMSWNRGAEQLFGYAAEEAVGKQAAFLVPPDRHDEEPMILERIRRGERIDQYETIRQRKDGSRVNISLTVSPIRDPRGAIIGASKIARDVTERKRAQERQNLLLREMEHRIKNLFALAINVVALSGRSATNVPELVTSARERLSALARAHALTLPDGEREDSQLSKPAMLHSLIRVIIAPHEDAQGARFAIAGCDLEISGAATASLALLFHEFATNAAKYGALSTPTGQIEIACAERGQNVGITWTEQGGPTVTSPTEGNGFGAFLTRMTVAGQLGGEISQDWKPEGLVIRLSFPRERLAG